MITASMKENIFHILDGSLQAIKKRVACLLSPPSTGTTQTDGPKNGLQWTESAYRDLKSGKLRSPDGRHPEHNNY